MGYYTDFSLVACGYNEPMDEAKANDLMQKIMEETPLENGDIYDSTYGGMAFYGGCNAKWYDYEVDIQKISREYPDVLFTMNGDGEETEDIWCHYWLGGKVQKDGIVILENEFDPKKLAEYERR